MKTSSRDVLLEIQTNFREKYSSSLFFRVRSFNMHAPYILSADDFGDLSGVL